MKSQGIGWSMTPYGKKKCWEKSANRSADQLLKEHNGNKQAFISNVAKQFWYKILHPLFAKRLIADRPIYKHSKSLKDKEADFKDYMNYRRSESKKLKTQAKD